VKELARSQAIHPETLERLRVEYEDRIEQLQNANRQAPGATRGLFSSEYEQISLEALMQERRSILQRRNQLVINDEVFRRIQRDIDLAEARLKGGGE